jgi:hypothetical protein
MGATLPCPKTGNPDQDHYVFECEATLLHEGQRDIIGFIDLFKRGCFILEAKQGSKEANSTCRTRSDRHE